MRISDWSSDVCSSDLLMNAMEEAGFLHYEISNFCREDAWSRHNTAYWREKKYLGIGPSAHSFDGQTRSWNVSNNHRYTEGILQKEPDFGLERLSANDCINERIMTGLRTMWGVDLAKIEKDFGAKRLARAEERSVGKECVSTGRTGWK